MATNQYFSLQGNNQSNEVQTLQDMTDESIQINGHDLWYLPRTIDSVDTLFGEDVLSSFDEKYEIEMLILSFDGYQGEDILASFGINVTDQIEFEVSVPRFTEETGMEKPKEGDLIYWPVAKTLFEIKFIEDELQNFYAHGNLYTWKIKTQLFDYAHEEIIPLDGIDLNDTLEGNAIDLLINPDGEATTADGLNINDDIEIEGATVISYDESNPFGAY